MAVNRILLVLVFSIVISAQTFDKKNLNKFEYILIYRMSDVYFGIENDSETALSTHNQSGLEGLVLQLFVV